MLLPEGRVPMKKLLSSRKNVVLGIIVVTLAATIITWARASAFAESAAGPVTPVEVVNNVNDPVPVTGMVTVGNFGEEPFQETLTGANDELTVPTDRRLVIKYVSGQASNATACRLARVTVETRVRERNVAHSFIPTQTAVAASGALIYVISQETSLSADPGTIVRLNFSVTTELPCAPFVSVAISGHLEKVKV